MRMDTVVYKIENNLYINLTNNCLLKCEFCVRKEERFGGYSLKLKNEPSADEVIAELKKQLDEKNNAKIEGIVFCGFGEPTYKMDEIKYISQFAKSKNLKIRLNTNGLGNLINGQDITVQLKGLIDTVSISLNAPDAETYDRVTGFAVPEAFEQMLDFAKECLQKGIKTILTAVDVLSESDLIKCCAIAKELGADFRVRKQI